MDEVTPYFHGKIPSNGAGLGIQGVRRANGAPDKFYGVGASSTRATRGLEVMKSTNPLKNGRSRCTP